MLKTVGFPSTRTGDQTIVNGNLVIGTAGKGIDFSANANQPGATSELLDDYETGTWTPFFTTSGGSTPAQTSTGTYTKVGNVVHFWFKCTLSAPITDVYYTTDFPFQGGVYDNVGTVANQLDSPTFQVASLNLSRIRAFISVPTTTFVGFGTLKV